MSPPPGATAANPDLLDVYVGAMEGADQGLNDALAGLPDLLEGWNAGTGAFGGRIDVGKVVAIDGAVDELSYLDLWVGRVADAFRDADRICSTDGCPAVLLASDLQIDAAGPPSLARAVAEGEYGHLFVVERDGSDGRTRVVRLTVDALPEDMSELEWQLVVEEMGLTGAGGPLHTVVHGWGSTSSVATDAGLATADLYDQQGVEGATVLVVDWDAGDGPSGIETPWDFDDAEESAQTTGDALAPLFTAIARSNPDADVNVTAHSLGNHVASRALSRMDDPSSRFSVSYLMVQPAIPAGAATDDTEHYGALVGPRVRDLTVTVNTGDDALFWYEARPFAPEALGDEAADGPGLTALVEWRQAAGLDTQVVDHNSDAGGGHLGLSPDGNQGLVRSLTQEQIDALSGSSGQADVRRWIYATYSGPDSQVADVIIDHPAIEAYFARRQEAGVAPTVADVECIIRAEVFPDRAA
ncbi:MAG TPA: alpha/beta hydrolase [Iamia sp.]